MKILFVSAEGVPFYKAGGLGDVAYALPKQLVKNGVDIRAVLPFYEDMPQEYKQQVIDVKHFNVHLNGREIYCGVKTLQLNRVVYYFIDNEYYFKRHGIYGYPDDGERYAFYNLAVLEMMKEIEFIPDVLHVNDWHTAMIPVVLKDKYFWIRDYRDIKTVITIHNLKFQGVFDQDILYHCFGIGNRVLKEDGVLYFDKVNFLKGGINYADAVTTVSPTYANEIQTCEYGENLDGLLRHQSFKLSGILNGIDYDLYNPNTDPNIAQNYNARSFLGKANCKKAIQKELHLPQRADVPLYAMITRLTAQKGLPLFLEQLEEMLQRDIQLIVLGTGEAEYEQRLQAIASRYAGKFSLQLRFDEALSHRIYAGSDVFLMPSAFEPCGLSQMISQRYATLPLVHEVGGLKDTVAPYNEYTQEGTGFSFVDFHPQTLLSMVDRVNTIYYNNKAIWKKLMRQAMKVDSSWKQSSKQYEALYQSLIEH